MKSNRIAVRLVAYFAAALLLFSVVVGSVFAWMFSRYSSELHRRELEARAIRIASTMSGLFTDAGGMGNRMRGMGGGYGMYLRFLDDIAMADVWLVDRQSNQITMGMGHSVLTYKNLPPDAGQVIEDVYSGKTAFSENFSGLLEQRSLTVGAPILSEDGEVLGAVLLHSPIDDLESTAAKQIGILAASILVALLLTAPLAVLLSLRFTRPLGRMKQSALLLAGGDYSVKNNIRQHDEIGELADSMDILADRLAEAALQREHDEDARRKFLTSVSHELRTPVTVMRGSLEALCDGVVSDPVQMAEYHRQMLNESIHMQRLVNDLLELSRLQSADFSMEVSRLNLCDIVEDVARSMRRVADGKGVSIQTERQPDSIPFTGDYSRLRQMLMIATDNAVKFSPHGETVLMQTAYVNNRFAISVTDKGGGIDPENISHIFERFHKGNGGNNQHGAGLGLAIAKEIASRHGVNIEVNSRPGHTEFRFLFP